MLEFEGIRIPTLFKIILVVKDSIEAYYFKLVELRIPTCLRFDRVKNSINLVESRTPLKCDRVKGSIDVVESKTPLKYDRVKDSTLKYGRFKDSISLVESRTLLIWWGQGLH